MNHDKGAVLDRTPTDEPVFVPRAQDVFAICLVAQWVAVAEVACINDEKVESARNDLRLFGGWLDAGGQRSSRTNAMEHLPDIPNSDIATTASNILNDIRRYLKSPDKGQFVRSIIEDELFHHDADAVRDPHGILAWCAVGVLGLAAGFFTGSL